jgi:cytochrome c-type biogenesis protein CcmH
MTTFWMICALLLAVALLFVVLPLWRSAAKDNHVLRDAANLEIFRDQIAEMDADLHNGLLTPELYEQGKRELQARMLEEVKPGGGGALARNPLRALALTLAVAVPLAAIGLYWKLGNHEVFQQQEAATGGTAHIASALRDLEERVAKNPKDKNALLMLARAYAETERYLDSAKTYNKLTALVPNDAQLWADFADVLAMASGQRLAGHPTMLIDKALEIDPNNPKALALAGSAAMERADYAAAATYWEKLLPMIPKGSQDAQMFEKGIQQAREQLAQGKGGKPPQATAETGGQLAAGGRISGTVALADAVKAKANPEDTLFLLARAAEGPPMPLAVIRKQVKDLPMQFALDDSMSMSPQMKLSNFDRVVVVARISKSGNPMPQPGDLQGTSGILKPGSSGVKLSIDSVVGQ